MTGLWIAVGVIVGLIVLSALCVAVMALIDRLWRRVAARIWGRS